MRDHTANHERERESKASLVGLAAISRYHNRRDFGPQVDWKCEAVCVYYQLWLHHSAMKARCGNGCIREMAHMCFVFLKIASVGQQMTR
eukprot:scaffold38686_cov38-Prasinocladus_malaysianus.AAC.1